MNQKGKILDEDEEEIIESGKAGKFGKVLDNEKLIEGKGSRRV
jgi:hypothetical protein